MRLGIFCFSCQSWFHEWHFSHMKKPTFFLSEKKFSPKVLTTWFYAFFFFLTKMFTLFHTFLFSPDETVFFPSHMRKMNIHFKIKSPKKFCGLCFVLLTMIKLLFFFWYHIWNSILHLVSQAKAKQNFSFQKKTLFSHFFLLIEICISISFTHEEFTTVLLIKLFFHTFSFFFFYMIQLSCYVASHMISFFSTVFFSLGFTFKESEHFRLTKQFLLIYLCIYFLSPAKKRFSFGFQHELFDLLKYFLFLCFTHDVSPQD